MTGTAHAHGDEPDGEQAHGRGRHEPGDEFVQALARGLEVIRAFDGAQPEATLSDVARRTGLSRATSRRLLKTLVQLGYASQHGDRYALTPLVLELGFSYLSSLGLPEIVDPHLRALSAELGESANAAVLDGDRVVYIARVQTRRLLRLSIAVGTRLPAAWTSLGRALLAELSDTEVAARIRIGPDGVEAPARAIERVERAIEHVRSDGYALVDQELEPGLRSIAMTVRRPDGSAACAVNVAMSSATGDLDHIRGPVRAALARAVAGIERDLAAQAGR